jgi:hypothetical protein
MHDVADKRNSICHEIFLYLQFGNCLMTVFIYVEKLGSGGPQNWSLESQFRVHVTLFRYRGTVPGMSLVPVTCTHSFNFPRNVTDTPQLT